ncbi:MAG TPA: hypothetical protein VN247_02960, partial [Arenimonas sp.]|nr:hypothetical protein [Arenimonas sp.]
SNDENGWVETGEKKQFYLDLISNKVARGKWVNTESNTSLPILLNLIDTEVDINNETQPCARDAFALALERRPDIKTGKVISFSKGRSYKTLVYGNQTTIELIGNDVGLSKINDDIALDQSDEQLKSYFEDMRWRLSVFGFPQEDEFMVEPTYWDNNFVSINFYQWNAGMGRNGISAEHRVWDVVAGTKVNLWTWLAGVEAESELPTKLRQHLLKGIPIDIECKDYMGKDYYYLKLVSDGLNIYEDAYGSGCENDFNVKFKDLAPFLSENGKDAIARILSNQK